MNELPFGEEVFAEVRKNVMARIARPRRFVAAWSFAAAAAAAIAIVFLMIPARETLPTNVPRARSRVAQAFQPVPRSYTLTADSQLRKPKPRHHHEIPFAAAPVRIEIQTADPDVRIIWITDRRTHEESGNDVPGRAAGDDRRSR